MPKRKPVFLGMKPMLPKKMRDPAENRPQADDLELIWEELEALRARLFTVEPAPLKVASDQVAKTRLVREIIKSRRCRDSIFGADLFGEPAWDLLLELYLAQQQQMRTSVSDACRASASPATTGLRWIRILEEQGWVKRESDPLDARRMWVSLTDRATEVMQNYLEQLALKAA